MMKMKKYGLLAVLSATAVLLSGCADAHGDGDFTASEETADLGAQVVSYEATIAKLREELRELRQAQLVQSCAYEERIRALEALLEVGGTLAPETPLFAYRTEGGGVTVTAYLGADTRVEIPSEIDGLPVLKLGKCSR